VTWSTFDNSTLRTQPMAGQNSFRVPRAPGRWLLAEISDGAHNAAVYLRDNSVVGVSR